MGISLDGGDPPGLRSKLKGPTRNCRGPQPPVLATARGGHPAGEEPRFKPWQAGGEGGRRGRPCPRLVPNTNNSALWT